MGFIIARTLDTLYVVYLNGFKEYFQPYCWSQGIQVLIQSESLGSNIEYEVRVPRWKENILSRLVYTYGQDYSMSLDRFDKLGCQMPLFESNIRTLKYFCTLNIVVMNILDIKIKCNTDSRNNRSIRNICTIIHFPLFVYIEYSHQTWFVFFSKKWDKYTGTHEKYRKSINS